MGKSQPAWLVLFPSADVSISPSTPQCLPSPSLLPLAFDHAAGSWHHGFNNGCLIWLLQQLKKVPSPFPSLLPMSVHSQTVMLVSPSHTHTFNKLAFVQTLGFPRI